MAESVNIRKLEITNQLQSGDYLIIETSAGTRIIDYKDLLIDKKNTTFASDLSTYEAGIASNQTLIKQLTGSQDNNNALVASVSGLSGLQWKGPWDTTTVYSKFDVVEYDNSSFVAEEANANNTPAGGSSIWSYIAKKGTVTLPLSSASAILSHDGSELVEIKPESNSEIGYVLTSQGTSAPPVWSLLSYGRP